MSIQAAQIKIFVPYQYYIFCNFLRYSEGISPYSALKQVTMKRKTRIERVYNEDTGWFETREVELNSYSFTDDDRIMIVREYMESGLPAEEIIKKYYISSRTVLFSWMDKFLNEKDDI